MLISASHKKIVRTFTTRRHKMSNRFQAIFVCLFITTFIAFSTSEIRAFRRTTTTTTKPSADSKSLWIDNRIPKAPSGCKNIYVCKKKVKYGDSQQKPCVKYCVKGFECADDTVNKPPENIDPNWCVVLDQTLLREFDEQTTLAPVANNKTNVMQVNMIDFPCQDGYLPDFRGRCREVW